MALTTPPIHTQKPSERGERFKRGFAQSTYITVVWTWFLVLAGKAAEPVLVISVLYASLKLLPTVHFPPQFDAMVFVAQFVALDVGGLSLNKLAGQALKEGNVEGAKQAKRLSIALVSVMLAGVIIAGVDQVVRLDQQVSTVINTILLIARAIMAVLYSRVIHALKPDNLSDQQPLNNGVEAQETLRVAVNEAMTVLTTQFKADQAASFQDLSQRLEQQLHLLDTRQDTVLTSMKEQQAQALIAFNPDALTEAVMSHLETMLTQRLLVSLTTSETRQKRSRETKRVPQTRVPAKHALLSNAGVSRKQELHVVGGSEAREHEVDAIVWPLLDAGKTVRGIEAETGVKKATVGRSRLRWVAIRGIVSDSSSETDFLSHETPADEVLAHELCEENTS